MPKKPLMPPSGNRQIVDLPLRLQEVGKIKMGGRNQAQRKTSQSGRTWYPPVKFDYFMPMLTKKDAEGFHLPDEKLLFALGYEAVRVNGSYVPKPLNDDVPPMLTEIDIFFPYNDPRIAFQSYFAFYDSKMARCRGDGHRAQRIDKQTGDIIEVNCPCEFYTKDQGCKMNGILSCVPAALTSISGVYTLRTTGWHSTTALQTSINVYFQMAGHRLFGIPFVLRLSMGQSALELKDGSHTTSVYPVASIDFRGTPEKLLETSFKINEQFTRPEIQRRAEMETKMLAEPIPEEVDFDKPEISEFYPKTTNSEVMPDGNTEETEGGEDQGTLL